MSKQFTKFREELNNIIEEIYFEDLENDVLEYIIIDEEFDLEDKVNALLTLYERDEVELSEEEVNELTESGTALAIKNNSLPNVSSPGTSIQPKSASTVGQVLKRSAEKVVGSGSGIQTSAKSLPSPTSTGSSLGATVKSGVKSLGPVAAATIGYQSGKNNEKGGFSKSIGRGALAGMGNPAAMIAGGLGNLAGKVTGHKMNSDSRIKGWDGKSVTDPTSVTKQTPVSKPIATRGWSGKKPETTQTANPSVTDNTRNMTLTGKPFDPISTALRGPESTPQTNQSAKPTSTPVKTPVTRPAATSKPTVKPIVPVQRKALPQTKAVAKPETDPNAGGFKAARTTATASMTKSGIGNYRNIIKGSKTDASLSPTPKGLAPQGSAKRDSQLAAQGYKKF
jgi:hypothetical protein